MTKRRAERLTGYEIRELPPERGLVAVGAFEGDNLVVKGVGRTDFFALGAVVQGVYMLHSRKAMEQHGWRCSRSGLQRGWRSTIANTGRTAERIASRTWSRSAGIVTS